MIHDHYDHHFPNHFRDLRSLRSYQDPDFGCTSLSLTSAYLMDTQCSIKHSVTNHVITALYRFSHGPTTVLNSIFSIKSQLCERFCKIFMLFPMKLHFL